MLTGLQGNKKYQVQLKSVSYGVSSNYTDTITATVKKAGW
jgi:hypothetical protein